MIFVLRFLVLGLLLVPTTLFAQELPLCEDLPNRGNAVYDEQTGTWSALVPCKDVVVVTARRNPTFASVVNNKIVPFIDEFVLPFLYSIAILVFMFGIFKFFFTGGAENREKGQQFALWGLIGFVVLFSLWGLVNMLIASLLP